MKAPNFLCCATLAFVNQRIERSWNANRSHRVGQRQPCLPKDDEHDNTNHCDGCVSRDHGKNPGRRLQRNRRSLLNDVLKASLPFALLAPTNAEPARGACLSGDIRAECIGVYKLPFDATESPGYLDTPEKLREAAPDLRWVPPAEVPRGYDDALALMRRQRRRLNDVRTFAIRGDIEKAGLALLEIVPGVNAAGIFIVKAFGIASNGERNSAMKRSDASGAIDGNPSSTAKATTLEMRAYRIETSLEDLLGFLGETDVLIGQGLRGELGVSAPAQIQILSNIADCCKEFDVLLRAIPESVAGLI